jgi:hypothetical protein
MPGIRKRLAAVGLGAHFVSGFDRRNMSAAELDCWSAHTRHHVYRNTDFEPSSAEVAHMAASAAVFWEVFNTGAPALLVEDDATFMEGFAADLPAMRAAIGAYDFEEHSAGLPPGARPPADLAWLSCFEGGPRIVQPDGCHSIQCRFAAFNAKYNLSRPFSVAAARANPNGLFNQFHGSAGCTAYIAFPRGARKLLGALPAAYPLDIQMNRVFSRDWLTILHMWSCRVMEMKFASWYDGFTDFLPEEIESLVGEVRSTTKRPDMRRA